MDRIDSLAEGLRRVVWEYPDSVTEIFFHPLGLIGHRSVLSFDGYRRLVVAPFVNDVGLDIVAPGAGAETVLVSRAEGLNRLAQETVEAIDCRVVSTLAGLAAAAENDSATARRSARAAGSTPSSSWSNAIGWPTCSSGRPTPPAPPSTATSSSWSSWWAGATKLGVDRFVDADEGFAGLLEAFVPGLRRHRRGRG